MRFAIKTLVMLAFALVVGAATGYAGYPLLHPIESAVAFSASESGSVARVTTACDLGADQIDHLASRIAPLVVERLATSGLSGVSPDQKVAAQQHAAQEKTKSEQAAALTRATQMVDQLIASRQVTQEGLTEARKLLEQSGQADQSYLLMARVAAAVNRGELTTLQAGLMPPMARQ